MFGVRRKLRVLELRVLEDEVDLRNMAVYIDQLKTQVGTLMKEVENHKTNIKAMCGFLGDQVYIEPETNNIYWARDGEMKFLDNFGPSLFVKNKKVSLLKNDKKYMTVKVTYEKSLNIGSKITVYYLINKNDKSYQEIRPQEIQECVDIINIIKEDK